MKAAARMSGVSGLIFAALLVVALVLVHHAPGLGASDQRYTNFYNHGNGHILVTVGLYIVPFAGIAFMWHMATIRTLLDDALPRQDSVVHRWLLLGSGLIFVAMLFAGSASVGAPALITDLSSAPSPEPATARTLTGLGYGLVFVYSVRAAGMFMLATTRLARQARLMSTWLAVISYIAAAFLLVSTTFHPALLLIFPAWTVLTSVLLLVKTTEAHDPSGDIRDIDVPQRLNHPTAEE